MGTAAEWVIVLLLILGVILLLLAYRSWQSATTVSQGRLYASLYQTMYTDSAIREIFYQIEYGKFKFDSSFPGSKTESTIDRLLSFADLVCDLSLHKAITQQQVDAFQYEFLRVYENPEVKKYLETLYTFHRAMETGTHPFGSFVAFCESRLRVRGKSKTWEPFPELTASPTEVIKTQAPPTIS